MDAEAHPRFGFRLILQFRATNFVNVFVHLGCLPLAFAVINVGRRPVAERLVHSLLTVEAEILLQ